MSHGQKHLRQLGLTPGGTGFARLCKCWSEDSDDDCSTN